MATQLGQAEIRSIEGTIVKGWFRSCYEKNVYSAYPGWGAGLLYDAFSSLCDLNRSESDLRLCIKSVTFTSPNAESTEFSIEVTDPSVLSGLETGHWDSYYLG